MPPEPHETHRRNGCGEQRADERPPVPGHRQQARGGVRNPARRVRHRVRIGEGRSVDVLRARAVEPVDDRPQCGDGQHRAREPPDRTEGTPEAARGREDGRDPREGEHQPFHLRRRGRGEEDGGEDERGGRAPRQPHEHAEQAERGERRDGGVGVVPGAVVDQMHRTGQRERHARREPGRHDQAEQGPGAPAEGDEQRPGLDVDQRRVEPAERVRRERLERRQEDGVLLVLHQVGRVAEHRPPDVAVDVERVRLRRPHRPAVPLHQPRGHVQAQDRDRQHAEGDEGDELEHAGGDPVAGRRERPDPGAATAQKEARPREEQDDEDACRRQADAEARHRAEGSGEPAAGEADSRRQPDERGAPAASRRKAGESQDHEADDGERGVERDQPGGVAHGRCPSQTPSTTPVSSNVERTAADGSPKTITDCACCGSSTTIAG